MQQQVDAWAQQNKVDVHVDFITSVGNKLLLTAAAEAQAKTGHDCIALYMWDVVNHADALANHDDLLNRLIAKYGPVDATSTYMAKIKGHWRSLPTSSGTQTKPPCARIGWFKQQGLDITAMYPVQPGAHELQDSWTYDAMFKYAEAGEEGQSDLRDGARQQSQHRRDRPGGRDVPCVWCRVDRQRR